MYVTLHRVTYMRQSQVAIMCHTNQRRNKLIHHTLPYMYCHE